jgi:hypothetical protein
LSRKATAVVCAALAAALISACGDDNEDKQQFGATVGSGTTSALSKDEFLLKANAICELGNKELDEAAQALGENPSSDEVTSFATESLVPSIESQIGEIRALGAPVGDEAQVTAILDAAAADLDKVKADPSLVSGGGDPFADANQLADEYGLTSCGSGDDGGGADTTAGSGTDTSAAGPTDTGSEGSASGSGSSGGGSGGYAPSSPDSNGDGIPDPSN